ncbi:ATP-binding cassette domain-containing protein [Halobellus sp. GM3]|uniref:ATP-binding cassette domain-containing protein n=1 Tax=Halobellus sp. GM3 TaxID=3458410 RepID=UPI00403D5F5B
MSSDGHADGDGGIAVENVDIYYDDIQAIWDVSLEVRESDNVVSLVGPNGAGKTTILKAMSGLLDVRDGRITVFGDDIESFAPSDIVEKGFIHIPEDRELFPHMTVRENLEMGAYPKQAREVRHETMREVFELFPILEEKEQEEATNLSGGQQQMLAIGRGLMSKPRILALDEPSTGLAPQITEDVFEVVEDLGERGITVFLIEQHVHHALHLADRAYVIEQGSIVAEGTGEELLESDHIQDAYL